MKWGLIVKKGVAKGKLFKIADGLVIGRSKVDIPIKDPLVSSQHAKIIEIEPNLFMIKDQQSSNGTWIQGRRVNKMKLKEGLEIQMGESVLQIVNMDEIDFAKPLESDWRSELSVALQKLSPTIKKTESPIRPFPSPIKLEFIGGFQLNTKWYLGYGPRKVGSKVPDLRIRDTKAPETCFQVTSKEDNSVTFETKHPQTVTLNGLHVPSKKLENGDIIEINTSNNLTIMRVTFL